MIERFISCVTGSESSLAPYFKNRPRMLPIPTAFDGFILCSSFKTISSVVGVKLKLFCSRFKCL